MSARTGVAPTRVERWGILVVIGVLFAIPLVSMLVFTLRGGVDTPFTLDRWAAIVDPENARDYRSLFRGIGNSLLLAVVTVALMLAVLVPTMLLVTIRYPRLKRALEFVCIVPITIPAIVLVVGLAPVYSVVTRVLGGSVWTLALAYGITVLPYAYRAIQSNLAAVDVVTLAEAARSLGASWGSVLWRVLLPNLRRGVLAASFITVAVVLGEFTIASLLNRVNLQTALVQVSRSDPYASVIFSLLALVFAFVLLLLIGRITATRPRRTP